jgi:hypothetical protein
VDSDDGDASSSEEEVDSDEEFFDDGDEHEMRGLSYAVDCMLKENFGPAFEIYKNRLMEEILHHPELKFILPKSSSSVTSCTGSQDSSASPTSGQAGTSRKRPTSSKRPRVSNSEDGENGDEQDEDGNGYTQIPKAGSSLRRDGPLLACTYFKLDSEKYQSWRGCSGPGFSPIHRLK